MLPGHCKDVAVKDVSFPLTRENIDRAIEGKRAYTRCDHYVLRNCEDLAVVRVVKEEGKELFRPIVEHEVVSLPQTTVFIQDDSVDVINAPSMARIAQRHPGMTVVVQGLFNHISFIEPTEVLELMVVDVYPPPVQALGGRGAGVVSGPHRPAGTIYHEIDSTRSPGGHHRKVSFPCQHRAWWPL